MNLRLLHHRLERRAPPEARCSSPPRRRRPGEQRRDPVGRSGKFRAPMAACGRSRRSCSSRIATAASSTPVVLRRRRITAAWVRVDVVGESNVSRRADGPQSQSALASPAIVAVPRLDRLRAVTSGVHLVQGSTPSTCGLSRSSPAYGLAPASGEAAAVEVDRPDQARRRTASTRTAHDRQHVGRCMLLPSTSTSPTWLKADCGRVVELELDAVEPHLGGIAVVGFASVICWPGSSFRTRRGRCPAGGGATWRCPTW